MQNYITLLMTIPGVDRKSDIILISELGVDVSQWSSARKLAAWAGLAPGYNQSVGKKKSVRISKASNPCLVQVAHDAVKDKKCDYYSDNFRKISKRRGKKHTIIAIARKILVAIYHIFKTSEVFNPSDMADVETTKQQRIKYIKNNLKMFLINSTALVWLMKKSYNSSSRNLTTHLRQNSLPFEKKGFYALF